MRVKKLSRIIFILLIIFLPSQLGLHFWPEWAYVNGVRVDYFSPTIYFTDILVLLLALLELRVKKEELRNNWTIKKLLIIFFILIFSFLNIKFSLSPAVSIYKWLKVLEMGFLVWFVAKRNREYRGNWGYLLIPIVYEAVLAMWQFLIQGSVGGLWYLLGERTFTRDTPGIALAVSSGQFILRPYGTFPHPNVLAGFLLAAGLLIIKNIPRNFRIITAVLILLIFFLTLSRGSLAAGWDLRLQLNSIAFKQWQQTPVWGTGLGTSPLYPRNITNLALLHQPVHNIYLLVLSETGLIGLGLFLFLIRKALRGPNSIIHNTLYIILFLGLFDHYWLTLQQTQLLLAVVLGTIWACPSPAKLPGTPWRKFWARPAPSP